MADQAAPSQLSSGLLEAVGLLAVAIVAPPERIRLSPANIHAGRLVGATRAVFARGGVEVGEIKHGEAGTSDVPPEVAHANGDQ